MEVALDDGRGGSMASPRSFNWGEWSWFGSVQTPAVRKTSALQSLEKTAPTEPLASALKMRLSTGHADSTMPPMMPALMRLFGGRPDKGPSRRQTAC
jgi:hypothetical protein